MNDAKQLLMQMAKGWRKINSPMLLDELVLKHGREFQGTQLPKKYKKGKAKECFKNAAHLCLQHDELTYHEGYVLRSGLPLYIHHAWCVNRQQAVVDNTIEDPEECSYVGIPFPTDDMTKQICSRGVYGLLDGSDDRGLEFLRKLDPSLYDWVLSIRRQVGRLAK